MKRPTLTNDLSDAKGLAEECYTYLKYMLDLAHRVQPLFIAIQHVQYVYYKVAQKKLPSHNSKTIEFLLYQGSFFWSTL